MIKFNFLVLIIGIIMGIIIIGTFIMVLVNGLSHNEKFNNFCDFNNLEFVTLTDGLYCKDATNKLYEFDCENLGGNQLGNCYFLKEGTT